MSFKNILFPIDFSGHSLALNRQVEWLAARFDSQVTLLHVFELPSSWYAASEATIVNMACFADYRKQTQARLNAYRLNVPEHRMNRVLAEGDPAWQIAAWVSEHDVDLIVMGSHGYGKLAGVLMGSVTSRILHGTRCPVWIDCVRPNHMDPIVNLGQTEQFKIVCGLERTEEGFGLLQHVKQLAKEMDAAVHLVHCVPKTEVTPVKYTDFDLHRYMADVARVEIARLQRQAGTNFPLTISGAGIAEALAQVARRDRAELIVTGRGKVQGTFGRMRTHTFQMIHEAPCPVLSCAPGCHDARSTFFAQELGGETERAEQAVLALKSRGEA